MTSINTNNTQNLSNLSTQKFASLSLSHLTNTQVQDFHEAFGQFVPKTLKITQRDAPASHVLALEMTYGKTLARIFACRGIDDINQLDMSVGNLLPASKLLGIDKACQMIDTAIDENWRILVVGDFDCDGATSTTLMVRALRQMGADVEFLVPDRFKFGYGLTKEIVAYGIERFNPKLIITVDNGISSHEGVAKAHELGVKVIITDHHLTTKPSPDADAVVNPNQLGCSFDSKALVGVGVAFYVMGRLAKLRKEAGKSTTSVVQFLDLVALGTIADVGHLDQNNRILVTHGLNAIRQGRCCVGILAILQQAGRDHRHISADDFGFAIAPRINAAGRMDNMRTGVECLLTDDFSEATKLAGELNRLNLSRRAIETKMKDEAGQIIDELHLSSQDLPKALSLYQDSWHQGVIGIVAGRIKEQLHRPTIVFAPADVDKLGDEDLIKGSARSILGVHIRDVIEQVAVDNPKLILHFGGHAMAAGLTICKKDFGAFGQALQNVMQGFGDEVFDEEHFSDGALLPHDFSLAFAKTLKDVSIWGNGFAQPAFDGVFEVINFRILKDKHLKITLRAEGVMYPVEAIWFNYDTKAWDYRARQVHLLYTLDINEWQGVEQLQLMVKDLAVCAID